MEEMSHKKKHGYKTKMFWLIALGIFFIGFLVVRAARKDIPEFSSTVVQRVSLVQSVSEIGSVTADLDLTYGWEVAGRVVSIEKSVGDTVKQGEAIATLEQGQQRARLLEAQARFASAQSALTLALSGPSDEQRVTSQARIDQARAALGEAQARLEKTNATVAGDNDRAQKAVETAENDLRLAQGGEDSQLVQDAYADLVAILKSVITTLSDAFIKADAVVGVENFGVNDDFEEDLKTINPSSFNAAQTSFRVATVKKQDAQRLVSPLSTLSDHGSIDAASASVESAIQSVRLHLEDVEQILQVNRSVVGLTQAELDTLRSNITTAQTNINTKWITLTDALQAITSARNSLHAYRIAYDKALLSRDDTKRQGEADIAVAKSQVVVEQANVRQLEASHQDFIAPPRAVDLGSLRANVSQEAANVQALRDDFDKTILRALSDGVLAKLDIDVGETALANQEVVSIISTHRKIEVDISETDIAKVSVGNLVRVTLDAFGESVPFGGKVVAVEPSETEVSGVIYYRIDILLDATQEQYDVRPGMTANIDIITNTKTDVLVIPERALFEKNGKHMVRVLTDRKVVAYEEREVEVGLKGDEGQTEILSGLSQGEEIITFIKEE